MKTRFVLLGCLLLALGGSAHAADEIQLRVYQVHYLDVNEAAMLARQTCLNSGKSLAAQECEYRIKGSSFFEFMSSGAIQEAVTTMLRQRDVPPPTQVFQVTLLVAQDQPPRRPKLPAGADAALDDLEALLPFRSYELLDSGIMRTADRSTVSLGGDLGYQAELNYRGDPAPGADMQVEFQLNRQVARPVTPATGGDSGAAKESPGYVNRRVVSTSFSMKAGETVVVGTSKLDGGDQALIVLLTALTD